MDDLFPTGQDVVMKKSIVDTVRQKCYILVGGEACAAEKSPNQCCTVKTPLPYGRAVGKQGRSRRKNQPIRPPV
jgi:hypothetical protein